MTSDQTPRQAITDYVHDVAPELNPDEVSAFMAEHAKPDDEPDSHLAWAVRTLRERGGGESAAGDGLTVDRVVDEIRRRER